MPEGTAYCGIECRICPAFLATRSSDPESLRKVAEQWSEGPFVYTADDIHCYGCFAPDDRVMAFCRVCEVRRCGASRAVDTCADCGGFPCDLLAPVWEKAPMARARLEGLRPG
jgi:hypothetical protein